MDGVYREPVYTVESCEPAPCRWVEELLGAGQSCYAASAGKSDLREGGQTCGSLEWMWVRAVRGP